MAPTFRHGKGNTVLWDQYNLTGVFNEATFAATVDTAETTVFGNNDKTYIPGQRDATVDLGGLFAFSTGSTSSDTVLQAALGASTSPILTVCPEGATAVGRRALLATIHEVGHEITAPVADVVKASVSGQVTGGPRGGVLLRPLAAVTSTGNGTAVARIQSTASSTKGYTAHMHLTAGSTITSFTVTLEHSSNNGVYTTLAAFTASTDLTKQRLASTSATVKRYTRASVTTFTGGAAKTATFAVALSRNSLN